MFWSDEIVFTGRMMLLWSN